MTRVALLALLLVALVGAAPASASTSVSWYTRGAGYIPPFWPDYMRIISVSGGDGVNHQIVVKPSGAQQLNGFPQKVDIYDYADTIVNGSGKPCHLISTHHALCVASGGPNIPGNNYSYNSWPEVDIGTGDGNDSVEVNDPLNPISVLANTGAGNDHLTLGNVWTWYYEGGGVGLGPGDDVADIGPSPATQPPYGYISQPLPEGDGLLLFGDSGDDTINMLNGSPDRVICGDGSDTLVADPYDDNHFDGGYGPPQGDDCESRTPPAAPSP
jgi:hypothetical protein